MEKLGESTLDFCRVCRPNSYWWTNDPALVIFPMVIIFTKMVTDIEVVHWPLGGSGFANA